MAAMDEKQVRRIVREELSGMFGLVLRRTQDDHAELTRSFERNIADEVARHTIARIFGELLKEYGDPPQAALKQDGENIS